MRMRAVYPDFWQERKFAALSRENRLGLIAFQSYVQDNGVGLDDIDLAAAALFPYEVSDPSTKPWMKGCLLALADAGIIYRFTVRGVEYLEFTEWDRWQKPKNPGVVKFQRSGFYTNGEATETVRTPSADSPLRRPYGDSPYGAPENPLGVRSSEFGVRSLEIGVRRAEFGFWRCRNLLRRKRRPGCLLTFPKRLTPPVRKRTMNPPL
jgi:hypothetical protein